MVMNDYFIRLFHYNDWANARQLSILSHLNQIDPKAAKIMTHIVMTQRLWLHRITGAGEKPPLWDPLPYPELIRLSGDSTADWIRFLGSMADDDLDRLIAYHNFKGIPYQNSVRDITAHVVGHSSHHRGQINLLIRQAGGEPPLVDYIAFARHEF
jgi:uncharacterized damage-inducible protein DinB